MNITFLKGYPDKVGRRLIWSGFGTGPLSYAPATGDPIYFPLYGNSIDAIPQAMSTSGNYEVKFAPSAVGARANWSAFWFYSGRQGVLSVVQNAAGSGMTPGTYTAAATGGGGTGASITVVVATATTLGAITITPGYGYTSAPTFAPATGGTPATFTVAVAPASGQVASAVNLSAESVQLSGFGGTY